MHDRGTSGRGGRPINSPLHKKAKALAWLTTRFLFDKSNVLVTTIMKLISNPSFLHSLISHQFTSDTIEPLLSSSLFFSLTFILVTILLIFPTDQSLSSRDFTCLVLDLH